MNRRKHPLAATMILLGLFASLGPVNAEPQSQKEHKEHKDKGDKGKDKTDKPDKGDKEHKAKKQHHNNGKNLLGDKIKGNGRHVLKQKGDYTTAVDVKDGKIAGVHVKHAKKGDVPVKKYKTTKNMAMARPDPVQYASLAEMELQDYIGTVWIGYSYIDDYGDEEIYWFPYDMILDGDTGAVDYYPAEY